MDALNFNIAIGGLGDCSHKDRAHNNSTTIKKMTKFIKSYVSKTLGLCKIFNKINPNFRWFETEAVYSFLCSLEMQVITV